MNKEKQIEERACEKCLHYEGCLKRFRRAKKNGQYELIDETEYFAHADECDFFITGYRKQSEGTWVARICEFTDGSIMAEDYYCSKCFYETFDNEKNFCPNCGAKMKGGDSNEHTD